VFSFSELCLIILVALLVLGPRSVQDLLRQIEILLRKKNELFTQLQEQWLVLKKEQRLEENNKRAQRADEIYKNK